MTCKKLNSMQICHNLMCDLIAIVHLYQVLADLHPMAGHAARVLKHFEDYHGGIRTDHSGN